MRITSTMLTLVWWHTLNVTGFEHVWTTQAEKNQTPTSNLLIKHGSRRISMDIPYIPMALFIPSYASVSDKAKAMRHCWPLPKALKTAFPATCVRPTGIVHLLDENLSKSPWFSVKMIKAQLFCDENGICNEKTYWSETPLLIFSWSKFNTYMCPNCALKCAN